MKKISLLAVALSLVLNTLGQEIEKTTIDNELRLSSKDFKHFVANKKDADASKWMNYGRFMNNDVNAPGSYFRNYLYPDSTVQTNFSSGVGYVWKHSIGQVIDPYANVMADYSYLNIGQWTSYSIDSIGIIYRYNRFNDVGDYLMIQLFETESLTMVENSNWQSGASYGYAPYDYTRKMGAEGAYKELRYDLTENDTALVNQRVIPIEINSKEFSGPVAIVVTFFPGQEANLGDTIDYLNFPDVKHKVNAFLAYDYTDELPYVEVGNFNMGQMITTSVRYNNNDNGWNGRYIPGTSYASSGRIYSYDMAVKIRYDSQGIGINELSNRQKIYPNPTGNFIKIDAENFNYKILDITGQVIESNFSDSGNISLASIAKGTYILQIDEFCFRIMKD
ncbi:MAG: T9SS type A sorting domain-containing protein [Bacteroidia bacterium]